MPAAMAPDQPGATPPLTEKTDAVEVASSGAPAQIDSQAARSAVYVSASSQPTRTTSATAGSVGPIASIPSARSGAITPDPPSTSTDFPGYRRAIQRAATTAGFM